MKKFLSLAIVLSLISFPLLADSSKTNLGGVISVNGTSQVTTIDGRLLQLVNDGSQNVYFKINSSAVATTNDFFIKGNESMQFVAPSEDEFRYLSTVCLGTNTSTLRYLSR
jgi:hypothetical protein